MQTQGRLGYTTTNVFYGHLYVALARSMSETLAVKAACQGYAQDGVMMIQVQQSLVMGFEGVPHRCRVHQMATRQICDVCACTICC